MESERLARAGEYGTNASRHPMLGPRRRAGGFKSRPSRYESNKSLRNVPLVRLDWQRPNLEAKLARSQTGDYRGALPQVQAASSSEVGLMDETTPPPNRKASAPVPRKSVPPAVPTLAPVDKKARVAERIRRVIFALRPNLKTQDQVTLDRCLTLLAGQEAYIALGIGPGGAVAQNNKLACTVGLIVFAARRLRDYARSEIEPKDLEPALLTLEDLAASGWAKYDAVADGPVWFRLKVKE